MEKCTITEMSSHESKANKYGRKILYFITLVLFIKLVFLHSYKTQIYRRVLTIKKYVVNSSCSPEPQNEGKLVHIDCLLTYNSKFKIPKEYAEFLSPFEGLFLETEVEIYLPLTKNSKAATWLSHVPKSFKSQYYIPYLPMYGRKYSKSVKAGQFTVNDGILRILKTRKPVELALGSGQSVNSSLFQDLNKTVANINDRYIYSGDPLNPALGDVRISFYTNKATHISAIGLQSKSKTWDKFGLLEQTVRLELYDKNRLKDFEMIVKEGDHDSHSLLMNFAESISPCSSTFKYLRLLMTILLAASLFVHLLSTEYSFISKKAVLLKIMLSFLLSICIQNILSGIMHNFYNKQAAFIQYICASMTLTFCYFLLK